MFKDKCLYVSFLQWTSFAALSVRLCLMLMGFPAHLLRNMNFHLKKNKKVEVVE